jgi:hypothetical protein
MTQRIYAGCLPMKVDQVLEIYSTSEQVLDAGEEANGQFAD